MQPVSSFNPAGHQILQRVRCSTQQQHDEGGVREGCSQEAKRRNKKPQHKQHPAQRRTDHGKRRRETDGNTTDLCLDMDVQNQRTQHWDVLCRQELQLRAQEASKPATQITPFA
jgi:hypothetical protein